MIPLLAAGCVVATAGPEPAPIIWVSLDTVRADRMGALGNTRGLTPNLDAFAADAVTFDDAWALTNITSMSHASAFTSRYPSELGTVGATFALSTAAPTVAEILSAYGYDTAAFTAGGHLHQGSGLEKGFATFDAHQGLGSFWHTVPKALAWLAAHDPARPSFLFVHSYDAHAPYGSPAPYGLAWTDPTYTGPMEDAVARVPGTESVRDLRLFPDEGINAIEHALPHARLRGPEARAALQATPGASPLTDADLTYARDAYDAAVAYADAGFGRLLAGLHASGAYDRSIIIVMSDHGESLGEDGRFGHGATLRDEELHVPLFIHVPAGAARHVTAPVTLLDLVPTICALTATVPPAGARGHSLLPWLQGSTGPDTPLRFAESNNEAISVRGAAGRLSFSGLMPDSMWLGPLLASTPLTSPAFALDTTAATADLPALRDALVTWRAGLVPFVGRSVLPEGPVLQELRARGYWSPK